MFLQNVGVLLNLTLKSINILRKESKTHKVSQSTKVFCMKTNKQIHLEEP